MNAHKFVAQKGIEEAKRVLSKAKPNSKIYDLTSNKYHESRVITIPVGCSMFPTYKAIEVKEFIDLSELKQVVERLGLIEKVGGISQANYFYKNFECVHIGLDLVQCRNLGKAIADYELVESYKKEKVEVLDMVDVSPNCEVRNG